MKKSTTLIALAIFALVSCTKEKFEQPASGKKPNPDPSPIALVTNDLTFSISATLNVSPIIKTIGIDGGSTVVTGTINWGDGFTEAFSSSNRINLFHAYAVAGNYTCIVDFTSALPDIDFIQFNDGEITAVSGLNNLTGLKTLNMVYNHITSIDISSNTLLEELNLNHNNLTSINTTSNTALTLLIVSQNNLTSLNLATNTALNKLVANTNNITAMSFANNSNLGIIFIDSNPFTVSTINNILVQFDSFGTSSHVLTARYTVAPTGAGLTAKSNLISKGWSVETD